MKSSELIGTIIAFIIGFIIQFIIPFVLEFYSGEPTRINYPQASPGEMLILAFIILVSGLIGAIVVGVLIYLIHQKHGKEEENKYSRRYEQEPPYEYPPAYAGALMDDVNQQAKPKDFLATIFYLDKKGLLDIKKTKKGYKIVFRETKKIDIPSVRKVYDFLNEYSFKQTKKGENELYFKELERRSIFNQEWFSKFFIDWQETVKQELKEKKLISGKKGLAIFETIMFAYIISAAFFSALIIYPMGEMILYYLLGIPFGFSFFGATASITLRAKYKNKLILKTKEGDLHQKRWAAFQNFVKEFSQMEEHPPMHKELWDEIMVYSISLGVAEEAIKAMKINQSETSNSSLFTDGKLIHFTQGEMAKAIELFSTVSTVALPIAAIGVGAGIAMGGGR